LFVTGNLWKLMRLRAFSQIAASGNRITSQCLWNNLVSPYVWILEVVCFLRCNVLAKCDDFEASSTQQIYLGENFPPIIIRMLIAQQRTLS